MTYLIKSRKTKKELARFKADTLESAQNIWYAKYDQMSAWVFMQEDK
jgi:hypothetical protein